MKYVLKKGKGYPMLLASAYSGRQRVDLHTKNVLPERHLHGSLELVHLRLHRRRPGRVSRGQHADGQDRRPQGEGDTHDGHPVGHACRRVHAVQGTHGQVGGRVKSQLKGGRRGFYHGLRLAGVLRSEKNITHKSDKRDEARTTCRVRRVIDRDRLQLQHWGGPTHYRWYSWLQY